VGWFSSSKVARFGVWDVIRRGVRLTEVTVKDKNGVVIGAGDMVRIFSLKGKVLSIVNKRCGKKSYEEYVVCRIGRRTCNAFTEEIELVKKAV